MRVWRRCAPEEPPITSTAPALPSAAIAGRALPITHAGSVDVFLDVIDDAVSTGVAQGAVLVVNNGDRNDEACVGDLVALEAREAGLGGIVIWGRHRDTAQIIKMAMPQWSLGARPALRRAL